MLTKQETYERRHKVLAMRRSGMTLRAIADHFGFSKTNSQHLINKALRDEKVQSIPKHENTILALSSRPQRGLRVTLRNEIKDSADITAEFVAKRFQPKELIRLPNFGVKALKEVAAWLKKNNVELSDEWKKIHDKTLYYGGLTSHEKYPPEYYKEKRRARKERKD